MGASDRWWANTWRVALIVLVAGGFIATGWAMSRGFRNIHDTLDDLQRQLADNSATSEIERSLATLQQQQNLLSGRLDALDHIHATTTQTQTLIEGMQTSLDDQSQELRALQASLLQIQEDFPVIATSTGDGGFALLSDTALANLYSLVCEAVQPLPSDRVLYPVSPGDTLWQISARFTGNPALYGEIARANNLPANETTIWPGQWLWIPTRLLSPTLRESQPTPTSTRAAEICLPYNTSSSSEGPFQLQLSL